MARAKAGAGECLPGGGGGGGSRRGDEEDVVFTATVEYGPREVDLSGGVGRVLPGNYTPLDLHGDPVSGQQHEDILAAATAELRRCFGSKFYHK